MLERTDGSPPLTSTSSPPQIPFPFPLALPHSPLSSRNGRSRICSLVARRAPRRCRSSHGRGRQGAARKGARRRESFFALFLSIEKAFFSGEREGDLHQRSHLGEPFARSPLLADPDGFSREAA